jgi:hypothetical protein
MPTRDDEKTQFVEVAGDLEIAGLLWAPEIGDEVTSRENTTRVSVLVDPQGMRPDELRLHYLWLPTVEQMVFQFEARQAILFHAGLELSPQNLCYKTVVQAPHGQIECRGTNLRISMGLALRSLLLGDNAELVN